MDAERIVKRTLVAVVGLTAAVTALGAVTAPDDRAGGQQSRPSVSSSFSHEELQRAANMTQQMSTPNANTDSQYHTGDEQLARSASRLYVAALEQHQADTDRMLGREVP